MTNGEKMLITQQRRQGLGYTEIARKLGMSVNTVKSYCQRNGIKPVGKTMPGKDACRQCAAHWSILRAEKRKQCFNRGELPQYFVAEDHEPIIDRETFDEVQTEIAHRAAMYTITGRKAAEDAEDDMAELMPIMELNDRIHCGICGKKYRRKMARLGTPYAAPIWICGTYSYRGKTNCASKQIPEKILIELIVSVMNNDHSADDIDHMEMYPNNRVLFVFTDGRTEEHFWKDHSRKDSWDAAKRKQAAEKTKAQHQARKERAVR